MSNTPNISICSFGSGRGKVRDVETASGSSRLLIQRPINDLPHKLSHCIHTYSLSPEVSMLVSTSNPRNSLGAPLGSPHLVAFFAVKVCLTGRCGGRCGGPPLRSSLYSINVDDRGGELCWTN